MRTYALDTETYYDKDVSVVTMGVQHYCRHPDFECYMVTVSGDDGYEYAGPPEGLDWSRISGAGTRWVSHNLGFDGAVVAWLRDTGKIPADASPEEWRCTADLCAWYGLPRALAKAVEMLINQFGMSGVKPDKSVRDRMKGRRYQDLDVADRDELISYAIDDARNCLILWTYLSEGHLLTEGRRYPDVDRQLSTYTARMGWHGVPVDKGKVEAGIRNFSDLIWQAERDIPWADGVNPVLSPKQLALECAKVGIVPPKSLAQDSEECAAWEDQYGEQYPWVNAMRTYRRCNSLKKKLETMLSRIKDWDGRMAYDLKFAGAHTRRWSGAGGVNMQNLPRKEMFGVNFRELIKTATGRTFVICDLAQIEPRCLHWLAGDTAMLDAVRAGYGIYEAFAKANNMAVFEPGTLKHVNPAVYQTAKAMCLGCGYGVGPGKFAMTAPLLTGGAYTPTLEAAEAAVGNYRARNPKITGLWKKLEAGLRRSVNKDFTVELPSHNLLRYRRITSLGGYNGEIMRGGNYVRSKLYGGLLTENLTQSMARDVFADMWGRIIDRGVTIVMTVHDELVAECAVEDAENVLAIMLEEMAIPPAWAPGLPVAAEGEITNVYKK